MYTTKIKNINLHFTLRYLQINNACAFPIVKKKKRNATTSFYKFTKLGDYLLFK